MKLPATLYIQSDSHKTTLFADQSPEATLEHSFMGAGQVVGVYELQRTVTIKLGAITAVDIVPAAAADALPAQLFIQLNRRGQVLINRTAQVAAMHTEGDGTVGVYQRTKYVAVGKSVELADVVAAQPVVTAVVGHG
jgi:hypothetical protein